MTVMRTCQSTSAVQIHRVKGFARIHPMQVLDNPTPALPVLGSGKPTDGNAAKTRKTSHVQAVEPAPAYTQAWKKTRNGARSDKTFMQAQYLVRQPSHRV